MTPMCRFKLCVARNGWGATKLNSIGLKHGVFAYQLHIVSD